MRLGRDGLLTACGALSTALMWRQLKERRGHDRAARWLRTNHADRPVTLLEGVALVAGSTGAAIVTGSSWPQGSLPYAVACLGAGALGAVDDLRQDTDRKGLAGHLAALAHGRVTTGAIKVLGLAATGLVVTAWHDAVATAAPAPPASLRAPASAKRHTRATRIWGTLAGGAVVAGSANLANLCDLRPGRALKVGVLTAIPLVLTGGGSAAGAVTLGTCAALLPDDLAGTSMLGDTGANPLGAALGVALVQRQGPGARTVTLAVITGLTLLSEKVSFTTVIESTPVLRELDQLGRGTA